MVHLCNQDSIVIRTLLYAVFKLAWGNHAHTNTLHSKSYCLDPLLIAKLTIGSGQSKKFSFPIILWVYLATSSFLDFIWHGTIPLSAYHLTAAMSLAPLVYTRRKQKPCKTDHKRLQVSRLGSLRGSPDCSVISYAHYFLFVWHDQGCILVYLQSLRLDRNGCLFNIFLDILPSPLYRFICTLPLTYNPKRKIASKRLSLLTGLSPFLLATLSTPHHFWSLKPTEIKNNN